MTSQRTGRHGGSAWLGMAAGVAMMGLASACAPPDDPTGPVGTLESAMKLAIGFCGSTEIGTAEVVFNLDGSCSTIAVAGVQLSECTTYDDIELEIDGVSIPPVATGGLERLGSDAACRFPAFKLRAARGVFTGAGPHRAIVRVGGRSAVIEAAAWTIDCRVRVNDAVLIPGSETTIIVEPTTEVEAHPRRIGFGFVYDDSRLNAEWFKAEKGMSGWGASLASFDGSDLDDRSVVIRVPVSMPAGTGTLSITNPWRPKFTACPFAACGVSIPYSCEAARIAVRRP